MYKYKIIELLESLQQKDHRNLAPIIHELLDVSVNTFINYGKIPLTSNKDIPYTKVRKLEIIFGIMPGELINAEIQAPFYKNLPERKTQGRGRSKGKE